MDESWRSERRSEFGRDAGEEAADDFGGRWRTVGVHQSGLGIGSDDRLNREWAEIIPAGRVG